MLYKTKRGFVQRLRHQSSLDVADLHRRSDSEARIDGLEKRGLKPVQERHGAVAYAVKRQHPRRVVQVHAYPGWVRPVDGFVHPVVPGGVSRVGAEEAPGLVVVSQQAQRALALPADAPVGHADGELPAPLDFPVEATARQGLAAQHLGEAVEPLRAVAVGLQVSGADDLSAALGDVELFVGGDGVQLQLAEVWMRRTDIFNRFLIGIRLAAWFRKKNVGGSYIW